MKKENRKETYLGPERWFKPSFEPVPVTIHMSRFAAMDTSRGVPVEMVVVKLEVLYTLPFVHHTVNCVERVVVVIYTH
jgi:hypothetical protein